jgi:hypothetical protein
MKSKRADVNQAKDMKESLRMADDICRKLKGRLYSDSTKLVREDRDFTDESSTERELTVQELLAGVTEENRHAEVDFGRRSVKNNARHLRRNSQCGTLATTLRESNACRPPA